MPTEVSQSAVLEDLIQEMGANDIDISEAIKLSPPLVLAACLLYVMAADGKIQEQESSQLQQVIGGNDGLLAHALAYVKAFPVEKFLEDAPSVLSQQDKLCIMANVCDSMLADGSTDARELEMFNTFREAFDLQRSEVDLIVDAITLKNNKEIFGEFEPITSDKLSELTPHMAMAVSIVYMMSADGSIGQEEIGQLETMVGEFEGLQEFALKIVLKIKRSDFLKQAKHVLDKQQRLCVLLNVCDSMMSDESVGILEDKLFVSMLDAFAVKESGFKKYYEVLELKNIKSFDVGSFEYSIEHVRTLNQQEQKGIVVEGLDGQTDAAPSIQRTMDSNTEKVTNDFGSKEEIQKVQDNATHQLEKQKILDIKIDPNLQKVLGGTDADKNIQPLAEGDGSDKLKIASTESRVENLQKVVSELSVKLKKFEAKNKSLLNEARVKTNNESSKEPAFGKPAIQVNKPKISSEAVIDNLQTIANKALEANQLTAPKEAIKDNHQAIASDAVVVNKNGVAKETFDDNLQAVPEKAQEANTATVAKEIIVDNLLSLPAKPFKTNDARAVHPGLINNRQPVLNIGQALATSVGGDTSVKSSLGEDGSDGGQIQSANGFASQTEAEAGKETVTESNPSQFHNQAVTSPAITGPLTFKKKQSFVANIFGKKQPSTYSLKFYVRVLATFFVMSLWTSNIAATRLDMSSMVYGHLLRISTDPSE